MLVLALDASTYAGSVALIRDNRVLAESVVAMRGEREERLMPAVVATLAYGDVAIDQLDAVACGAGPGSFTSLRIAASIAKGISAARQIPLHAAPSTLLVAAAEPLLAKGRYVVAMDAMRGEFFGQEVEVNTLGSIVPGDSWRGSRAEIDDRAATLSARVIGPSELPSLVPHARGFARLLESGLTETVDLTSWEPTYGRKAEAQVRWESSHGRELGSG